jgi:hypothetical protein
VENNKRSEEWWKTPQPAEEAPDLQPIVPGNEFDSADPPARITL